ncbi:MAG: isochorismatase family protein [Phycisphaeraceae bacterium JB051]
MSTAPWALFDVDTRTFDPQTGQLVLMSRMAPIAEPLSELFAWSTKQQVTELLTTCLTELPTDSGQRAGVNIVGFEQTVNTSLLATFRQHWLHRPCLSCAKENIACRTFDVFYSNPNAAKLVKASKIKHWVVVGSSLEYCLKSTALGLRELDCDVTVLTDLTRPARKSTPESIAEAFTEMRDAGIRLCTTEAFFANPRESMHT